MSADELMGTWMSDVELTMVEVEKNDKFTQEQKEWIISLLGDLTFTFTQDKWITTYRGERGTGYYKVLGTENGCYRVEAWDLDEDVDKRTVTEMCIEKNHMYIFSEKFNYKEVFTRQ